MFEFYKKVKSGIIFLLPLIIVLAILIIPVVMSSSYYKQTNALETAILGETSSKLP